MRNDTIKQSNMSRRCVSCALSLSDSVRRQRLAEHLILALACSNMHQTFVLDMALGSFSVSHQKPYDTSFSRPFMHSAGIVDRPST